MVCFLLISELIPERISERRFTSCRKVSILPLRSSTSIAKLLGVLGSGGRKELKNLKLI